MRDHHIIGHADVYPCDWLTARDLIDRGHDPEIVARLPRDHAALDGLRCWRADELADLLTMASREGHS